MTGTGKLQSDKVTKLHGREGGSREQKGKEGVGGSSTKVGYHANGVTHYTKLGASYASP
jgi:hypothetical protein